jgi:hydroxypyruvate isomerase
MPRFAANIDFLFTELPFLERFYAAKENGFRFVEFLFPYSYKRDEIAHKLMTSGTEVILFDFPAGKWEMGERGLASDPSRVEEFKKSVHEAVSWAEFLGVKKLNCLVGKRIKDVSFEQQWRTCVENLKYASEILNKYDLSLLIEPINQDDVPGYLISRIDEANKIISEVGSDNVFIQFDAYHIHKTHGQVATLMDEYIKKIAHIQIADSPGRNEPGTGEINYKDILQKIDQFNYNGYVSLEYNPRYNTENSLNWISGYGFRL